MQNNVTISSSSVLATRRLWVTLIVCLLAVFAFPDGAGAEINNFEWHATAGSTGGDIADDLAVDSAGNAIAVGTFSGTVDFDPGPGSSDLAASGVTGDAFVQKLDPAGNLVWAVSFGGVGSTSATGVAIDNSDNIYVIGFFYGTVDFDPGAGSSSLTSAGFADGFLMRLDSSGSFDWATSFGGPGLDESNEVDVGPSNNVVVTGYFSDTADFDPGVATVNKTSLGGTDVFAIKLNGSGAISWVEQTGGIGDDEGLSVSIAGNGDVVTVGTFEDTADFDPGVGTVNHTSAGEADAFVQKLDQTGAFQWVGAYGGSGQDQPLDVSVDSSGDVVVVGSFASTVDFDPGPGVTSRTSLVLPDAFVQKLDSSGGFEWVNTFGGSDTDRAEAVGTGGSGNIFVAGIFGQTIDFDSGPGTYDLTADGVDAFVSKTSATGDLIWAESFGGSGTDQALGVAGSGGVVVAGYFRDTADLDPGDEEQIVTSAGSSDFYVLKLGAGSCDGLPATIDLNDVSPAPYTAGDDVVIGTKFNDDINALAGDDHICSQAGSDLVRGGAGSDVIFGGSGDDDLRGGGGLDTIDGGDGADEILGQGGSDVLIGGDGDDIIDGQGAPDTIEGGLGDDVINGQNGGDTATGGPGDDDIRGQTGPDTFYGDGEDDDLFGGEGADTLYGGDGVDKCSGNTGPDSAEAATCETTPGVETLF